MTNATLGRLFSSASAVAFCCVTLPAVAQTAAAPAAEDSAAEADIIVTGSRITRPEIAFPNPVVSVSSDMLLQSGKTDITAVLLDTPSLIGSLGNGANAGSNSQTSGGSSSPGNVGTTVLDLRNLGSQRTLVLVNGRRHVNAYPGENSVDINTIPTDLIDRIDILTGGVSAIYGADGVSGVVNFVMKRKFEGLIARGQVGISDRGDAGNRFGSIVAGQNFADDRGNVTLAYEYNQSDRLSTRARDYLGDPFKNFQLSRDPNDFPDDPKVFDRKLINNVSWADSAPNGAVDLDSDGVIDFDGDGKIYDTGTFLRGTGGRATNSTSNTPTAGYFGDIDPALKRHNVNLLTSFEFSPAFRVFGEGKFVRINAFTEVQPSFDFGTFLTPDNFYLQQRFGAAAVNGALVNRDNFDLGVNSQKAKRDTYRGVIGFDGKLTDGEGSGNLKYEVSYVYGRASSVVTSGNSRVTDRYYAALDAVVDPATGKVTCRINLPGETLIDQNNYGGVAAVGLGTATGAPLSFKRGECAPISILGTGQSSQAGRDFVFINDTTRAASTQNVLSGSLSGDLGFLFSLPGGPIGFVVGGEYRKEKTRSTPSVFNQGGFFDGGAKSLPSGGQFDVKEVYGEINIPLLSNVAFAQNLSFGGAIRFSDYSTIGSTTTWQLNGSYSPVRDITFRGTYSRAVRAPNITELFSPLQGVQNFLNDPCDPTFIAEGTSFRVANCKAALAAAGLTPAQILAFSPATDPKQSTSQVGLSGGNPALQAETAKTWTAGVVLRPRFIPGLSITADWYDFNLRNAINTPDVNEVFKLCVDQPTLANVFCDAFKRNPTTGFLEKYVVSAQNVAAFTTSGLEVSANYRAKLSPSLGSINFRLAGGYLNDLTFIATVGGVPEQQRNRPSRPNYAGNVDITWLNGPLTVNYGLAWQGKTQRFTTIELKAQPDISDPKYFLFKERWEHDIQVSYEIADRFTIYGGINNFTNQQPDIAAGYGYPVSAVGRYFYAGAKIKLDKLF